jgi:hypothetical protein
LDLIGQALYILREFLNALPVIRFPVGAHLYGVKLFGLQLLNLE